MTPRTEGEWALPEPLGIHPESGRNGPGYGLGLEIDGEMHLVRWCSRNRCGGIYTKTQDCWNLITPIAFNDFLELLDARGILPVTLRSEWQTRRWMKACRLAGGELEGAQR